MYGTFKLEGFDELIDKLDDMGKNGTKLMNMAVEEGAVVLENEMKETIRANGLYKTGLLESSINHTSSKSSKTVKAKVGQLGDAYYGIFHEYGTSKMPARPWLSVSIEKKGEEAKEKMIEKITENLL